MPVRIAPRLTAYAALAASMTLVGSYVGLSRVLVAALPIYLLAWLRFGIAALAMAAWLRAPRNAAPLDAHAWRRLFLMSLFGNFGFSICMLGGVAATSALAAGVVMATLPCAVALLSFLLLRERIGLREAVAIALAAVAVLALANARGGGDMDGTWWGYALLVGAVFCEAMYVVLGARLAHALSPHRLAAIINLIGLLLMTPFGLWQARNFDFAEVTATTWGLLVFYALAASVVGVWLWMIGLRTVPASRAGVFTVCLPLASAAVGIGLLGERPTVLHGVGALAAIAGLLLVVRAREREVVAT